MSTDRSMKQVDLAVFIDDATTSKRSETACPTCHRDDFATLHGMRIHHTRIHGESISGYDIECKWCGESFHTDTNDRTFCSTECCLEYQSIPGNNPNWKGRLELTCEWCGSEYERPQHVADETRFCSRECLGAYVQSQREYPERIVLVCKQCNEEYKRNPSTAKISTFCSAPCQHQWRAENRWGVNHPQWTGGANIHRSVTVQLPRPWGIARRSVLERESECALCQKEISERKNVHHIIPVLSGGTNADDLLMLLCSSCHPTVEAYTSRFAQPHLTLPATEVDS